VRDASNAIRSTQCDIEHAIYAIQLFPMIKVLIVDDSLFMRRLVSDMLNCDPEIEVIGTAKEGHEAMKKISNLKPDCVTLDLVMPGWDGLTTLKHIMAEYPTPVVILSAYSKKDADVTIECLNAGAASFILKPSGELSLDIEKIKEKLIEEVKATSRINISKLKSLVAKKSRKPRRKLVGINNIIVIGASTGGPQTLKAVLSSLPSDFPVPIIIVQHMPNRFFTESLAERLNDNCRLEVKVAEDKEIIQKGKVYLAPGGFRATVKAKWIPGKVRRMRESIICLKEDEPDSLSPSIDVAMKSVADAYNRKSIGIILTGMGNDGVEGMRAIKESGGKTIVQDESALIFGMPKVVSEAGLADKILHASDMSNAMLELVS